MLIGSSLFYYMDPVASPSSPIQTPPKSHYTTQMKYDSKTRPLPTWLQTQQRKLKKVHPTWQN